MSLFQEKTNIQEKTRRDHNWCCWRYKTKTVAYDPSGGMELALTLTFEARTLLVSGQQDDDFDKGPLRL